VKSTTLLWAILLFCTAVELFLTGSDWSLWGSSRLRRQAYEYGGFWPGLLDNWAPNYRHQPWIMFLTYGFLHSGLSHLVVNMITLWSLGQAVINRVGPRGFGLLYVSSIIGGAGGFALLASGLQPMVGASGALFGLSGGLLSWAYVDLMTDRKPLWPVVQAVTFLTGLNLVLWWAMNGQLAWETHLGGFLIGWVVALLIDPRAAPEEPPEDP